MVISTPHMSSFDLSFVSQMGIYFILLSVGLVVWKYLCSITHMSQNIKFIECHWKHDKVYN
jgi:hypothetical protein